MAKFDLFYPVTPATVNQAFGANAAYYSRFKDAFGNPEKGHMGVDFTAYHGQPVYAAHDGLAHYEKDEHGGEGIHVITTDPYVYKNGQSFFKTIYWHMCSVTDTAHPYGIPTDGRGYMVRAGDLLGYADNTGAPFESSGDHLHFGLYACNGSGVPLEPANGFGGCIDPMPYFNGYKAVDAQKVITILFRLKDALVSLVGLKKGIPAS